MLTRRRAMMASQAEGEEEMKEWKLLDEIDLSATKQKEYNIEGVTEILIQGTNLRCSKDTASSFIGYINGKRRLYLNTMKLSETKETIQQSYMYYNGLFYRIETTVCSQKMGNWDLPTNGIKTPELFFMDDAPRTLKVSAGSPNYPVESGIVQIYAR